MFKKIVTFLGYALGLLFGAVLLNAGRKGNRAGTDKNKRDIGESVDRTGSAISRQGQAIDRAIGIVGSDKERKSESAKRESDDAQLIADSRAVRERAKELLDRP